MAGDIDNFAEKPGWERAGCSQLWEIRERAAVPHPGTDGALLPGQKPN